MEKQIKYWIDLSDYDLETAEAMLPGSMIYLLSYKKNLLTRSNR